LGPTHPAAKGCRMGRAHILPIVINHYI